jgi:hypothetical protein
MGITRNVSSASLPAGFDSGIKEYQGGEGAEHEVVSDREWEIFEKGRRIGDG